MKSFKKWAQRDANENSIESFSKASGKNRR
jgi:hypothetical protein